MTYFTHFSSSSATNVLITNGLTLIELSLVCMFFVFCEYSKY